jgi:hypothetical protein
LNVESQEQEQVNTVQAFKLMTGLFENLDLPRSSLATLSHNAIQSELPEHGNSDLKDLSGQFPIRMNI